MKVTKEKVAYYWYPVSLMSSGWEGGDGTICTLRTLKNRSITRIKTKAATGIEGGVMRLETNGEFVKKATGTIAGI
jgi:hypothetical protein